MYISDNSFKRKIDVVITWVDGEDPKHQAKRESFLTKKKENRYKDVAGATRYNQVGEIYYCVASILRFASWVNKIYIVTDAQDPHVDDFINKFFPDNKIPIELIDHKEIFKGYEEYLPTFNSLAITSMLWRIPGLSEQFLLFNDDVILKKEVKVEDFYVNEKSVLYGYWYNTLRTKYEIALQTIGRRLVGKKSLISFKKMMYNAAKITNSSRFIRLRHSPHTLRKSVFEKFYKENPNCLIDNIRYRFRNMKQYSSAELYYLLALKEDKVVLPLIKGRDIMVSPEKIHIEELKQTLDKVAENDDIIFFCVNSLDQSSSESIEVMTSWLGEILEINRDKMVEFLNSLNNWR